jgi:hypothetical protein
MTLKDKDVITPNKEALSDKDVVSFYNAFNAALERIKDENFKESKDNLLSGVKSLYNKTIIESKTFDDGFIDVLENAYPSFSKIARDPKRSLRYETDVVLVEKARRINSDSIKHLASHTQFIRQIDKDNNVIPDKIQTTFAEEDLAIYENRVYKTLVNIIINFLTRRIHVLEENVNSNKTDELRFNNHMDVSGGQFDIDLNIKMVRPMLEENKRSQELVDKLERMLTAYRGLQSTMFMKELKNAKDVVPPVIKTNIFLHNPDFQIIYNTWIFMERYQTEPYGVNIREIDYKNDKTVDKDLSLQSIALINELMYLRQIKDVEVSERDEEIPNHVEHVMDLKHDVSFNPGEIQVEKYYPSEVLLQKTLDLYKQSYNDKKITLDSVEVSARRTIDDMLESVNSICNNLFDYKDSDIDRIGVPREEILAGQRKRYQMLKVLREEKELDLLNIKDEENLALEHLNDIEKALKEELTKVDELAREGIEARHKKAYEEMLAMREEQRRHQEETIERHKEELLALARERAAMLARRGYHSKYHERKVPRINIPLAIYDNTPDDLLDLNYQNEDFKLELRRTKFDTKRKSPSELEANIKEDLARHAEEKRLAELERIKRMNELSYAFSHTKHKAKKDKRERRHIEIWDDTPTLDLFSKEKVVWVKKLKGTHKIMIKKSKARKVIGSKKTLVKKTKVEPKKETRKIVATKKKLVSKKVIKFNE